ncbi:PepSY-associated TM helix domain-containing protein [Ottowia testudinis]|uniref:PepSY domain-containing protein n=1 Tax=Ottowia testudinis TaxID=2816950 RepID=A0A975H4Q0_9BURK|nr:PepSY-associated TM helix domain-containing protein [Ottowia testudinis]QTD44147.1 PepSY domain-containing protein [Ottowia testudinis]
MKNGFRQSMAWLHTYSGLLVGWVLFVVFAGGTAAYFRSEITFWMQPELHRAALASPSAAERPELARRVTEWLGQHAAGSPRWSIRLPTEREPLVRVNWQQPPGQAPASGRGRGGEALLDPTTVQPVAGVRDTRGGDFFYRLHFDLHYLPAIWARWIVGFCAMFMLVAIVSGIVTHRRIFKDFFTFRPRKGQRSWLDAHNVSAVLALPYHLMITYTGLLTLVFLYMPWAPQAAYPDSGGTQAYFADVLPTGAPPGKPSGQGAPLADVAPLVAQAQRRWGGAPAGRVVVSHPGDASARISVARQSGQDMRLRAPALAFDGVSGAFIQAGGEDPGAGVLTMEVAEGLHVAHFASPLLRALFFLSGLAGCAMVATGLLLWAVKERPAHLKALQKGERGSWALRLVDGLNVGAVAGLLVAMPAFFWINRLLPLGMAERAQTEINAFFAVWGACAVLGLARPSRGTWRALLTLAGWLFALVPLLNAATGGAHWGVSVPAGLWQVAGFDAVCAALGLGLLAAARHLGQRAAKATRAGMPMSSTPGAQPQAQG